MVLLVSVLSCVASVGFAQPSSPDDIAELDRKALSLYQQVMSPFCPGRALSDCPSSKAHDLKAEMRQKLAAGTAPEVVLTEVFAKYGEQYRAVPGFSGFALVAWLAPLVFLVAGLLVALRVASGRRTNSSSSDVGSVTKISESMQQEIDEELSRID
jgi:cytochrome c-type biogenesis protein CcmH